MNLGKIALGISACATAFAFATSASAYSCPAASTQVAIGTYASLGHPATFYITSGSPFGDSVTANFGDGFAGNTTANDCFTFTIPFESGTGSGSISTSFSSDVNKFTITGLVINGTTYTVPPLTSGASFVVNGITISAGVENYIEVLGHSGSSGGTFSGTATFVATPVPEMATWMMAIAGFGVVGFSARRRQAAKVSFA